MHYRCVSPYFDLRLPLLDLSTGKIQTILLEIFEVLVFDVIPQ